MCFWLCVCACVRACMFLFCLLPFVRPASMLIGDTESMLVLVVEVIQMPILTSAVSICSTACMHFLFPCHVNVLDNEGMLLL